MKGVLLLGIIIVCVLPCLCRSTDCDKAVLNMITQIRLRLDELESAHKDVLDFSNNKVQYKNSTSTNQPLKLSKSRKHKRGRKHGLRCEKKNHEEEEKVSIAVESPSIFDPTTIDYTTETLKMIVSTDAENLTTELSGGFTDNTTTLFN